MGSPSLYWYPEGSARLRVITLPAVTGLAVEEDRDTVSSISANGQSRILDFGGRRRVRISLNVLAEGATFREVDALVQHARRGGTFGFSADHAKTWGAVVRNPPVAGATNLMVSGGNAFSAWSSAATVASGDIVRVEGPPPTERPELCAVSTLGGVFLTLSEALRGTPQGSPVIVRWRNFHPLLYLDPQGVEPLTSDGDRRIVHRLQLDCFEPTGDLGVAFLNAARLGGTGVPLGAGTAASREGMAAILADYERSIQRPTSQVLTNYFAPRVVR